MEVITMDSSFRNFLSPASSPRTGYLTNQPFVLLQINGNGTG
jgi:hypothetical protein